MTDLVLWLTDIGAFAFGLVIGWTTYRTLRRHNTGLGDIATVIGAVGGAAVTALFPAETGAFGAYCIGLALGFFGYVIVALNTPPPPPGPNDPGPVLTDDPRDGVDQNPDLPPTPTRR